MLISLTGCEQMQRPAQDFAQDPAVIARFDGGSITAQDIDAAILERPAVQRQVPVDDRVAWYEALVKEIATDRLLLAEAKLVGVADDPAFRDVARALRRQAVAEHFLRAQLPPLAPPSGTELQRYYAEHQDSYTQSARRLVSHLFLRRQVSVSREELLARAHALRQRALDGENFARLAEEHSASESRHQQGALGWIERGQIGLERELEQIIFGLRVGVPSQPIIAKDGVHLFVVKEAIPDKQFSFEEVKHSVVQRVQSEQRTAAIAALLDSLERPPETFILDQDADQDALATLLEAGDDQTVVLRIGHFELRLGQLRAQLVHTRRSNPGLSAVDLRQQAWQILHATRTQELVYQHLQRRQHLSSDLSSPISQESVETEVERARDRALLQLYRQRRLLQQINQDPRRLQAYYEQHKQRFSSPLKLRLRKLVVPLVSEAPAVMARLERFHGEATKAADTADRLESLAAEVGGTVESLDWKTLGELARESPKLARFVTRLEPGMYTPPFLNGERLELAQLLEKTAPAPPPFPMVRERVRDDYLENHVQALYAELRATVLREANFQVVHERLVRLDLGVPAELDLGNPSSGSVPTQ